jgi:hypothetical protein
MDCPKLSNPIDPTPEDLKLWAYTAGAMYPAEMPEDWDLLISSFDRASLLLEFASDSSCPNRKFFLQCLYGLVGDSVGSRSTKEVGSRSTKEVVDRAEHLVASVSSAAPEDVHLWAARVRHLISDPASYRYEDWDWGGFSNDAAASH